MAEEEEKQKPPPKSSLIDAPWFKWAIIGGTSFIMLIIAGVFITGELIRQQRVEEANLARAEFIREYENRFRRTMVRVYQNLQLEHYLAAYEIINDLEKPPSLLDAQTREYLEVLARVGRGLLEDGFFDEAELIFLKLLNEEDYKKEARKAIDQVLSNRRLKSAREIFESAKDLVEDKEWRMAANELKKARLEFESVKLFGVDSVDSDLKELAALEREARHWVHVQEAEWELEDAKVFMKKAIYDEVQTSMSRAAKHVGRAAFFKTDSQAVERLRRELFDLEAELAYRVPNLIPMFNAYRKEELELLSDYFFLQDFSFDISDLEKGEIKIGMEYSVKSTSVDFYVVRYKMYYFDGTKFFNGHYLIPKSANSGEVEQKKLLFVQEVPEKFKGKAIKRIDLKVFDPQNRLISRINRAFKRPS